MVESGRSTARKVLWILLVVFFPLGGALLWLLFGRK
ncbi:MAG TPA: PLD nuclease N-terminal domain-containing protein [Thermoanaerobaculia bacterium]|nr:PLD nuclease N-terminal domain-containing protein [Thermoanaerobaculia bacterium]